MKVLNRIDANIKILWERCILASIAHAITVAQYPILANEHSWDGINYNVQDNQGTRGTVTFDNKYCLAAFRNENSFRLRRKKYEIANSYFEGAPKEVINLAEAETLQYLLDEVNGEIIPLITTAFWIDEGILYSIDTYEEMLENGFAILNNQFMSYEDSVEAWIEEYEMTNRQIRLLELIYNRKVNNTNSKLILTDKEIEMLESDDEEGLYKSKISFEELQIYWES